MIVLGGALHHPGGIESFCERAVRAVGRHGTGWQADWWPTETAYFRPRHARAVHAAWRRLGSLDGVDLVWLQWSTLLDLLFLWRVVRRGVPVLVTPHLGARARLQRIPVLRHLCTRLLARADRLALLFEGQEREIALPPAVPRDVMGTFLPETTLAGAVSVREDGPLRLIHAGRLSAAKGTFRMIGLCGQLRARGVPFSARIVGRADTATHAAITEAIAHEGLRDMVTLTGWVDEAGLDALLRQADILVHLSELDSFPLIVLEALAAGATPIVADMAGAAAMVKRFGGLVTPGSDVRVAADWIAGQQPAALRRSAAAAAARTREACGWSHVVRDLERLADATLGDARRSGAADHSHATSHR